MTEAACPTRAIPRLSRLPPKSCVSSAKLARDSEDERVKLRAWEILLDRAYGKAMTPSELTGKDGAPLGGETLPEMLARAAATASLPYFFQRISQFSRRSSSSTSRMISLNTNLQCHKRRLT